MDSDSGSVAWRAPGLAVIVGTSLDHADLGLLSLRFASTVALHDFAAALEFIAARRPHLIVLTAGGDIEPAVGLLLSLKADQIQSPSVVLAKSADESQVRRLKAAGAMDCLRSPLAERDLERLLHRLRAAHEEAQDLQRFLCPDCPPGVPIAGRSRGIIQAVQTLKKVALSPCNPVLVLGETGTGKELAARAVHAWRCGDPDRFVAVNCATLNANLLESELFGHVKGAFTGADRDKAGLLEAADGGTLFLDEISEMPLELQAKLLRFLQERKFRKVGGTADLRANATVVASSNLSLYEHAMSGKFRRDLYYRLAVFPVELPPLRSPQRQADIPLLAEYFLHVSRFRQGAAAPELDDAARRKLQAHSWLGNVRELQNVVERAMIVEKSARITADSILIDGACPTPTTGPAGDRGAEQFSLETAEREFICRALQACSWQRTRAAELLGITRATLHAKIKRYAIRVPSPSSAPLPPE